MSRTFLRLVRALMFRPSSEDFPASERFTPPSGKVGGMRNRGSLMSEGDWESKLEHGTKNLLLFYCYNLWLAGWDPRTERTQEQVREKSVDSVQS